MIILPASDEQVGASDLALSGRGILLIKQALMFLEIGKPGGR
jgi:hypothetical protein